MNIHTIRNANREKIMRRRRRSTCTIIPSDPVCPSTKEEKAGLCWLAEFECKFLDFGSHLVNFSTILDSHLVL